MRIQLSRSKKLSRFQQRRQPQFIRAALVGIAAGAVAIVFQVLVHEAEQLRTSWSSELQACCNYYWLFIPLICAAVGAVSAWLTWTFAPEASGSGIPFLKAVLIQLRIFRWRRIIPVKIIGALLAVGSGFSLGREGPTIQVGAAVGSAYSRLARLPRRAHSHLIACGAGAALAAAFNAPLAGFIFVIEELRRELSPLTYGTALIAAVSADIVTRA